MNSPVGHVGSVGCHQYFTGCTNCDMLFSLSYFNSFSSFPVDQHLNVKEACKLIGKSESTIKRLIREITVDAHHEDRQFILPNHEEVERRKATKEPYVWKLDRQLLLRRFPQDSIEEEGSQSSGKSAKPGTSDSHLESALRDQVQSLENQNQMLVTQLDRKDGQISNLNERMRESNILMKELQQRLAITAPVPESPVQDAKTPSETIVTPVVTEEPKEKPKPIKKKPAATKPKPQTSGKKRKQQPKKRSFFGIQY
jgi:cell division septation protein DedD